MEAISTSRIYPLEPPLIAGELVDKIEATSDPQDWKVSDKKLASGVYIYVVTGRGGGKSCGKIGIIK